MFSTLRKASEVEIRLRFAADFIDTTLSFSASRTSLASHKQLRSRVCVSVTYFEDNSERMSQQSANCLRALFVFP